MASALVPLQTAKAYLGLSSQDSDEVVADLVASAEEELLRELKRHPDRPFAKAATGLDEWQIGTGSTVLALRYPVAGLTLAVTLGRDSANPDETLDPANVDDLVWSVGSRYLYRTDGGVWGEAGAPRAVRVRYDSQDDLPAVARLAVLRRVAALYRETGRPEATSERAVEDTADLPLVSDRDPVWLAAVRQLREPRP